ncbi:hypothetical protein GO986_03610 [Deinococcus sp. HMF7620]|uniref:Uncharacterized protein n=1 Tax=Deinococcus arboris TaxID=2682977 RepID=A0A7C9HWY1_9DEIO|nr:hypothetical protein [Deinococcus arboris]MVN85848.1 hypothetical protein [Deinococcus arboris]
MEPPSVRALGLWNASDGWSGGGVFDGNRKITVNHARPEQQLLRPPGFEVTVAPPQPAKTLLTSLKRTGWRVTREPEGWGRSGEAQKRQLELRFSSPLYPYSAAYRWLGEPDIPEVQDATWADFDRRGELLLAGAGRLFRVHQGEVRELIDLNPDQPRRRERSP